uniref:bifunctional hydroxymethylpyrimidine kinase/phosphomethylpyrimidine kinase n=1 Tax=Rhodococcus qingshengii TaxID=334542 RepID=UPI001C4DE023|nr:bifunctional hydroxymethylpyrimidine kinase/phosphomethylpyrimidine kinase [Rhodococcus qingshengii]
MTRPLSPPPRVLSIAGTDPTGGAGIQADLKTIAAHHGYGMAVVTALVAQNACGVRSIHPPPASFLTAQLHAVSDDVTIDAVKMGMLADAEIVHAVAHWLDAVVPPVVVLDPVMIATSGDRLLDSQARNALDDLIPRVHLVTPNVPELAVLTSDSPAESLDELLMQARRMADHHGVVVLVKGGHLPGDIVHDAIIDPADTGDPRVFSSRRIVTRNAHGTGCSMSVALATLHAKLGDWDMALHEATEWLIAAIEAGSELDVGHGHGPIDHFARVQTRSRTASRTSSLEQS